MILALFVLVLGAFAGPRLVAPGDVDAERASALFRGRRLALIVGPEAFADPAFAALRYTDDDARAVAAALADPSRGRFDQIWTLTGPAAASRAGVRAAMDALAREATSPADTVVVYFSTHGTLARDGGGRLAQYLVLGDTRLADVAGTGLGQAEVLAWLDGLPSRRRVALFATCHSGQGKSALAPDVRAELASTKGAPIAPLREVSEATVVIGVCAMQETARESDALGHDVYTWFLLEALERGDADGDGAVTLTEAHEHARVGTYAYTGGAQRAWARAEVLGEDPIVLSGERRGAGAAVVASYRGALEGYRVRVDGQEKGALPGQVVLPPGPHRVELLPPAGDRVVARQRVDLPRGRRVDLEVLLGRDRVRVGGGLGAQGFGAGPESAPALAAEVHLPRLLGGDWELVGQGSATVRWPDTTLSGGLVAERPLAPGPLQLRVGGGLQGWLLQRQAIGLLDGEASSLLAPSLVPVPVVSVLWRPMGPAWARLAGSGTWLWYADGGEVHGGWTAQATLVVGMGG